MPETVGAVGAVSALRAGKHPEIPPLLFMLVIEFAAFAMLIPVLPFFATEELGISIPDLGLILTCFSLAQLVGGYVCGRLADACGRRPLILFSFSWATLGFTCTAFVQGFWSLLVVRVLQGLSGGTIGLCHAFMLDLVSREDRASFLGMVGAVTGVSLIIGPGIGGVLVALGVSRRGVFLVSGGLALFSTLYGAFQLAETLPPEKRRGFAAPGRPQLCSGEDSDWAAVNSGLVCTWATRFVSAGAMGFLFATYAFLLRDLFGWADTAFAAVLVSVGVLGASIQLLVFPALEKRIGAPWSLVTGTVCGAVAFLLYPHATYAVHFLGVAVYCCCFGLIEPATPVLCGTFASERHLGFANGTAVASRALAVGITPVIATTLYAISPRTCFFTGAGVFCVSTLAALGVTVAKVPKAEETLPIAKGE